MKLGLPLLCGRGLSPSLGTPLWDWVMVTLSTGLRHCCGLGPPSLAVAGSVLSLLVPPQTLYSTRSQYMLPQCLLKDRSERRTFVPNALVGGGRGPPSARHPLGL